MAAEQHLEPPAWLKTLPVAPEYRPTLAEFLDPIAFILRIEKEASQYGICKIIPPMPPPPKSSALANLTRSLAGPDPVPTFSTRKQQVGLCPRRPRPVQRSVWQSGERYTLPQFEEKVRQFERTQLKRVSSTKKSLSPLETETLFWRSSADKPFTIEYANDMPGSCFNPHHEHHLQEEFQPTNVGETGWNMRGVSRERGSLLRFMKEEIPGVTSPMVYVAMMYSWFAWHVEDHDLHSMNYLHFGSGKTWYGVPRDARLAFEEAVRVHGYGEEVNPLMTFTMLGEKTTVMSPEVLVGAGIPCCRLVQNAGEFVVTFPGAYHSGFSHGFNCAEAANIATPGWLSVAKDAAIRRASTNTPPMVSHYQLLYSLALSVWPRAPKATPTNLELKSSRLKDKTKTKNEEAETMVKETFVESMMENNNFISMLVDRGGTCVILPRQRGDDDGDDISNDDVGRRIGMGMGMGRLGFGRCQKGQLDGKECKIQTGLLDEGLLSCVMCGILSFACVAVVQPREKAAKYLMSNANCSFFRGRSGNSDDCSSSDVDCDNMPSWEDRDNALFVTPIAVQGSNLNSNSNSNANTSTQSNQPNSNNNTALALLASAYSASDSDNDEVLNENSHFLTNGEVKLESRTGADGDVVKCDKDSSRKHVFCLEHALKVWREMQRIGGADVILLCHPEYPKIEAEAKRMARELGMIYHWKEFNFRDSSEAHKQQIKSALEDEEAVPTKSDWAVKMGINLYYSASQSKSPLYSKQMPYNKIIYKVFGQETGLNEELGGSGAGRRKRIVVAGRWCGKVWMTNQVHPYLASLKEESNNKEDLEGEKLYFRVPVDEGFERVDSGGNNSKDKNNSRVLKRVCGGKRKEVGPVGQGRRSGRLTGVKIEESKAVVVVERETCSTSKRSQRVRRKPAKFASCYVSSEDEKGEGEGEGEGEKDESGDETSSSHKCGTNTGTARQRKTRSVRKTRVSDDSIVDEIERDSDSELEKEPVRTRGKTRSVRKTRVSDESIKNDSEYESDKELVRMRGKTRSIRKNRVSDESILDEIDQDSDNESEKEPVRTKGRKNSSVRKTRVSDESILDEIDQDSENESEEELVRTKGRKNNSVRTTRVPDKIEQDTDYEFEPEPVAKPKGRKRQKQKHEIQSNLEFKCDIELCPMSFSSKQDLTTHKKNICHIKGCNKKFFSHKYMFSHQKVHIDERPLKCPWKGCKMAFKWPWARTEHIRVHTGARPYVCKEPGCGQTFRFVSDFSRHKRKTGHNSKGKKREK